MGWTRSGKDEQRPPSLVAPAGRGVGRPEGRSAQRDREHRRSASPAFRSSRCAAQQARPPAYAYAATHVRRLRGAARRVAAPLERLAPEAGTEPATPPQARKPETAPASSRRRLASSPAWAGAAPARPGARAEPRHERRSTSSRSRPQPVATSAIRPPRHIRQ